jgi:hypothetical protein
MPRNGANPFDVSLWADSLGLLPVPALAGDPRPRFVMLNGPTGNFCLDLTEERGDNRATAWSADVGHYVSVYRNDIEVQRWDALPSAGERFSIDSVVTKLPQFHNYLEKSQPRYERSVVPHVIRVFRMLRSSLQLEAGLPALLAFLAMLAAVTDFGILKWSTSAVCFGPPWAQQTSTLDLSMSLGLEARVGLENQGGAIRADSAGV